MSTKLLETALKATQKIKKPAKTRFEIATKAARKNLEKKHEAVSRAKAALLKAQRELTEAEEKVQGLNKEASNRIERLNAISKHINEEGSKKGNELDYQLKEIGTAKDASNDTESDSGSDSDSDSSKDTGVAAASASETDKRR